MKNYRIKDIAAMAGVSAGTVDRVLHNRGRVSEESLKKVKKALKKIDYQPNLIARSLASKKDCRIMALIPSFVSGEYWSEVSKGIDKAEQEFSDYHLNIQCRFFNQYDKVSFDTLIEEVKQGDYEGVIIATLFKKSTFEFTQWLDKKKIPYIFIDAYIENTNCIAYYGTDSYRSGYIGGRLLSEKIRINDNILLFNIKSKESVESTQVSAREKGFRNFLSETNYKGSIYPVSISAEKPERNEEILYTYMEKKLKGQLRPRAGIIFNSRVHIPAEYFRKHTDNNFSLIGYDAIEANIKYLRNGIVSHLIAQRPEVQGYNSVKALFYHLVLHQTATKMNYMPIDILIKENIDYYNNYI
ncbi:MAG: LacI family DNA-binding transcriptional regulator [Tannerella sp.]|jgi:LacI family transcriptional regulator|nr:LacI family DNA-binding transcriptional regulator [Tannerella sp.]